MTLADKIVVLRAGIIEQVGAPMDLYRDPDNKFVAGFIGSPAMNFVNGTAKGGGIDAPGLGAHFDGLISTAYEGKDVSVGARPEHITIDAAGDTHKVELTESLGGVSFAYLTGKTGERIVVEERGDVRTAEGATVGIQIEASRIYLFDAETEQRIRN
jgi:lactose/L-arabinose transport system ATP-binding protein